MHKILTLVLLLALLSSPVSAQLFPSDKTVTDASGTYTIEYIDGTQSDPRRGFMDPEGALAFRVDLEQKLKQYTEGKLATVESWPEAGKTNEAGEQDKSRSLLGVFMSLLFGGADKAKVAMRDNLRQKAKNMLRDARINVQIGTTVKPLSAAQKQTDVEEHLFLLISSYEIKASGIGRFTKPTVWVKTDYDTFTQVTSGSLEAKEALRSGRATFGGTGVTNRVRALYFSWLSKYA